MAPVVVQSKFITGTGAATLAGAFTTATTAGNCVVVALGAFSASAATVSVSAMTLGGAAGNFASLIAAQSAAATADVLYAAIWADPSCAGGQTAISATVAGGSAEFSTAGGYAIYEISGLAATIAALPGVSSAGDAITGTAVSSGTTATTASPGSLILGSLAVYGGMSAAGTGYTNLAGTGGSAGYLIPGVTGTYSYTCTASSNPWASVIAELKPPATAAITAYLGKRQQAIVTAATR